MMNKATQPINPQNVAVQPRKQGHRFVATLFLFGMLLQRCGGNGLQMEDDGAMTIAANHNQRETALSKVLPPDVETIVYHYVGGLDGLKLTIYTENLCKKEEELQACCSALEKAVFDAEKWRKYYGEVGQEPRIPDWIPRLLTQDCKLWPGKKVYDTHLLTLIPPTVGGKPLTLTSFSELIQKPQNGGHGTKYSYYDSDVKKEHGDNPAGPSHWALMTRDVLPDSRNQTYKDQCAFMQKRASALGIPYTLPSILAGAVSVLCHHVETGTKLFSNSPSTYSRCIEILANKKERPLVFGYFDSSGLGVSVDYGLACAGGVAGAVAGR